MMNTHPQQRTAFLSIWILFSAIIMGNVNCDARVVSTDESTCDSDQCISDSSEITVDGINGEKQLKDIGGIETQVGGGTNECALYLAQSSIPNAGIGMYTGKKQRIFFRNIPDSCLRDHNAKANLASYC